MKQSDALEILKLGYNVFLTGAAGAGKTYILNEYIDHLRKHNVPLAITASTGIAATHLNGQTIHSWCGMGTRSSGNEETYQKIASARWVKSKVKKAKVLIIDEVSMLSGDQLNLIEGIVRHGNENGENFGGIQVVLCGDFFQLPPITGSDDVRQFAFESKSWERGDFQVCYLTEQHRQGDDKLLEVLNSIRSGQAGEESKVPLRDCYNRSFAETMGEDHNPTKLFSKNTNVDDVNIEELEKLPGDVEVFKMTDQGFKKDVEALKKGVTTPEVLELKVGAEVIFTKNSPEGDFVNGTRGRVIDFDKSNKGAPIVETLSGAKLTVEQMKWQLEDEDGAVIASVSQLPLRLAWAITIHKSQGMTLDTAEMDLSDTFEPGMGYVALSRVRKIEGLRLMGLNDMALSVDTKVLEFDEVLHGLSKNAEEELSKLSPEELENDKKIVIYSRFRGERLSSDEDEDGEDEGKAG